VFGPPQPDFPPNTTVTGFPFYDAPERPPDPDLQAFLDSGPAPVVFTLGSSAVWAAGDFYRTAAAAVSALGCRAILLDGGAGGRPSGLPPDVRAFDYAPYGRLFGRARAVVHQGGVGTTAQALRAGRPQLVMPFGHDTLDNARRVVGLGTGLTLPRARFTPARLARALGRILGGEFDERASVLGARIRSEDGVGAAVDCLLERALIESRDRTPEAS
jgi:UDP:flavonoid glycosyltransferase YjiC (YdhE family)